MIAITMAIQNPSFRDWESFKNIRNWSGDTPLKNKFWEFELIKNGCIVEIDFTIKTRCDHAGVMLRLGLFGYSFNASIYDNRHWDYEKNRYVIYDNQGERL